MGDMTEMKAMHSFVAEVRTKYFSSHAVRMAYATSLRSAVMALEMDALTEREQNDMGKGSSVRMTAQDEIEALIVMSGGRHA